MELILRKTFNATFVSVAAFNQTKEAGGQNIWDFSEVAIVLVGD